VIRAGILLALVVGLVASARSFVPEGMTGDGGAMLALGFVLLAALQTGHVVRALGLPHLTGFLLCGAVFGPEILGLLTRDMVDDLALVKRVAVALIALSAGCELNLKQLRPRLRVVGINVAYSLLAGGVALFGLFYFLLPYLPFGTGLTTGQRLVVALVGANVLVARSPAVVMGIVAETRAAGPVTELALSVVVVADLAVVLAFSLTESLAGLSFASLGRSVGAFSVVGHILGSLGLGVILGALMAVFVQRIGRKIGLFIFALLFVIAEAGSALSLDPLLIGLAAGLFVENVSAVSGSAVVHETESASLPTYAIFFAVIGAEIHMHDFLAVAGWAVLAAVLRAGGFYVGIRAAAARHGLSPALWKPMYLGMLPQAGVALALALLVKTKFGDWGQGLSVLLFGTIVVNECVGPVLWRLALVRAGEAGRRDAPEPVGHARRASTVSMEIPKAEVRE
jgi:Kef-type K+ transport system membrane component KefB